MAPIALCVGTALLGLSCAGTGGTPKASGGKAAAAVAGTWEGLSRTTVEEGAAAGDTRIERHAWQLWQHGPDLVGFYVVELTMISGDGRPYVCSRTPQFSTIVRVELRGKAGPKGAELEEVGDPKASGPCRPTERPSAKYLAQAQGNVLTVYGSGRKQTLYRSERADAASELAGLRFDATGGTAQHVGLPAQDAEERLRQLLPDSDSPPSDIQGLWVWESRGMLPTGDEKHEREEWHLEQEGNNLTGYYDREIRQVSMDGQAYRCSGALEFKITTRYQVAGEIQGDRLVLREQGFEIIDQSPCDDGQRRLDAYQGRVMPEGEIQLQWGVGSQVLRRGRPMVPSQRF